jgi:hypothetical protein
MAQSNTNSCNQMDIQAYFDEFCFRINRSQFKTNIFHKTIKRMVESKPIYQNQIKRMLSV